MTNYIPSFTEFTRADIGETLTHFKVSTAFKTPANGKISCIAICSYIKIFTYLLQIAITVYTKKTRVSLIALAYRENSTTLAGFPASTADNVLPHFSIAFIFSGS